MRMNLRQFIATISGQQGLPACTILAFQGTQYPLLFFSLLYEKLKTHLSLETIDCAENDVSVYMSRLQTSFLGQSMVYWLKNVNELDEKKKARFLDYLSNYGGPHTLLLFVQEGQPLSFKSKSVTVSIDAAVDKELFLSLLQLVGVGPSKRIEALMAKFFSRSVKLSVDQVCLLGRYLRMAGVATDDLIEQWLDNIIQPEHSLFALSQYFFAKNAPVFLKEWERISSDYADVFWIAFWSEQLWRASQVVASHEQKQIAQAKSIGFRLPFSFLQNDWKKYTYQELKQAHDFVYAMDYQIKNGGEMFCFDLFYASFFNGAFQIDSN